VNMEIRQSETSKAIEKDIRDRYKSGKLKDSHIKKFLTNYYDGSPYFDCPTGCKSNCQLDCYIDIHTALVDDDEDVNEFKTPYVRDGEHHCCGMKMGELESGNIYCTVCGNEYED
jgi:hypothetical protein